MRLANLHTLAANAVLARDVMASAHSTIPLLRAGVALDQRYRKALENAGITSVWVKDELSEGVFPQTPISDEVRAMAAQAVHAALSDAASSMVTGKGMSPEAMEGLAEVAQIIAAEIQSMPDVALHLADMMGADQYLLQHVLDVTALGTVLARRSFLDHGWIDHDGTRRYDNLDARLSKIALGLLLHDIGKLTIPAHVLNKPGALDADEWALVKGHPMAGIELLGEDVSYLVKAVVRSHHERWDGSGYPDQLQGQRIHQFARLAAIGDVYDAVTSERSYKAAAPPHVGVSIIEEGSGTHFDPEAVRVFRRVVVPYPPGYEVLLVDGRRGVVVDVDRAHPRNPTVRVRNRNGSLEEIAHAIIAEPAVAEAA